jgi:hypothetical protein
MYISAVNLLKVAQAVGFVSETRMARVTLPHSVLFIDR